MSASLAGRQGQQAPAAGAAAREAAGAAARLPQDGSRSPGVGTPATDRGCSLASGAGWALGFGFTLGSAALTV